MASTMNIPGYYYGQSIHYVSRVKKGVSCDVFFSFPPSVFIVSALVWSVLVLAILVLFSYSHAMLYDGIVEAPNTR